MKKPEKNQQDAGQMTVFLALIFMMLMSCCFVMIEGVREYLTGAVCAEALEGAAQNVLANYDKPLFDRYHIFFLDPREKNRIRRDGLEYLEAYNRKSSGLFGFQCESLSVTVADSSLDQDGKLLKHEIREWMKYHDRPGDYRKIQDMFRLFQEVDHRKGEYRSELLEAPDDEILPGKDSNTGGWGEDRPEADDGGFAEEDREDVSPEAVLWKSVKEAVNILKDSGLLYACIGSGTSLSSLSAETSDLPSEGRKGFESGIGKDEVPSCSFEDVHEIAGLLSDEEVMRPDDAVFSDEKYIMDYIGEHYHFFGEEAFPEKAPAAEDRHEGGEKGDDRSALRYEKEYMLNGADSDVENLRRTVNRIFLQRFAVNYDYARKDEAMWSRAGEIAEAAAGQEGLPGNPRAGRLLLISAAAYGQSVTDLKMLLAGKSVPPVPDGGTWRAGFEELSRLLRKEHFSQPTDQGVSYQDYLDYYLMTDRMKEMRWRKMADVMQMNVRMSEEDFTMADSIFSFRWKAVMTSAKWFPEIPGLGLISDTFMRMNINRVISY